MTTTQKILLVVGVIAVSVLSLAGFLFYATAGLPKTTDQFLIAISSGQVTEAYGLTSAAFKQEVSQENLLAYAHELSLDEYKTATWPSRSIQNNQATLEGEMTLRSGVVIPLAVELIKESSSWKIYRINKKFTSTSDDQFAADSLPSESKAISLLQQTVMDFASALKNQDFSNFYLKLSPAWQVSTSQDEILEHFRALADKDVSTLLSPPPTVILDESPMLDENGLLLVKGHVKTMMQTTSEIWQFEAKYHQVDNDWKLFGFYVEVKLKKTLQEPVYP